MTIPNFSNLLNDVLHRKYEAIVKWGRYSETHAFNEQEIDQALVEIQKLSAGNVTEQSNALYLRAWMYQDGLGSTINNSEAIRCYEAAIKLDNNAYALNNRAFMYEYGLGGTQNKTLAACLYDQAIKLNNPFAMKRRAQLYENGEGGPKNYKAAVKLYQQAINLGHAYAMTSLAHMYRKRLGGLGNEAEALRLYEQASDVGDINAMRWGAFMHFNGIGGNVNYSEAIRLYEKAIQLGCVRSMFNRAWMHERGQGGKIDYREALRLYEKAGRLGLQEAVEPQERLKKLIQEEELAQEELAQEELAQEELAQEELEQEEPEQEELEQEELEQEELEQEEPEQEEPEQEEPEQEEPEQEEQVQAKESTQADLKSCQNDFDRFLKKLGDLHLLLNNKALKNTEYETVAKSVKTLYTTLKREMGAFFVTPSTLNFQRAREQCMKAFNAAENESAQHRGWHMVIPFIRAFVGILAGITLLPALLVQKTSQHGYFATFFALPKTKTSETLAVLSTQFNEIDKNITKNMS